MLNLVESQTGKVFEKRDSFCFLWDLLKNQYCLNRMKKRKFFIIFTLCLLFSFDGLAGLGSIGKKIKGSLKTWKKSVRKIPLDGVLSQSSRQIYDDFFRSVRMDW